MKIRVRCPVCGLLSHIERIHHVDGKGNDVAYPIEMYLEKFMGYKDIRHELVTDERLLAIQQYIQQRLATLAGDIGTKQLLTSVAALMTAGIVGRPSGDVAVKYTSETIAKPQTRVIAWAE
jgi:hypothetical protein